MTKRRAAFRIERITRTMEFAEVTESLTAGTMG